MRTAYFQNIHHTRVSFSIIIAAAILLLGFFYLYQINNLVRESYVMRGCQKEYSDLQNQYKKIEAEIAQAQSLPKLQDAIKDMNMMPAGNISYLGADKGKVVINYPAP